MKKRLPFALAATLSTLACPLAAASASVHASTVHHYTGKCLNAAHHAARDMNCEVSAVTRIGEQLFFCQ